MDRSYNPGLEVSGDRWIKLHRNENLFVDNELLVEIAKNVASSLKLSQYPDSNCTRLRKRLGILYDIEFDQIFVGNGSDEVLATLLHYLRSHFAEAAIPAITYRIYPLLLQKYGYKQLTLDKAAKNSLCIIDSPNSLTGEVSSVFDVPSAFLIWDNVYGEFAKDQLDLNKINSS